jgi:NTE family protein
LPAQELKRELFALRREQFWDPGPGLGLLRGEKFRARLASLLPVTTFEQCRIPLGLSVFEWRTRSTQVVESGPLAPALHASCAVPLLFQPVLLGGRRCADGGVLDRHGLASLDGAPGRGERVLYHHLSTRSPWRRKGSPSLRVPERAGLRALVVEGLPRLGPFKLERGPEAFERAAEATRAALDAR